MEVNHDQICAVTVTSMIRTCWDKWPEQQHVMMMSMREINKILGIPEFIDRFETPDDIENFEHWAQETAHASMLEDMPDMKRVLEQHAMWYRRIALQQYCLKCLADGLGTSHPQGMEIKIEARVIFDTLSTLRDTLYQMYGDTDG